MKSGQMRRLLTLEKQYSANVSCHQTRDLDQILRECPAIEAAWTALTAHILRDAPEPPRFYGYKEDEYIRRAMWAMTVDKRTQMLYQRYSSMLDGEVERRAVVREREVRQDLLTQWGADHPTQ
jgi:hypothetical protein